jgi:hypothetical protein
VTKEEAFKVCGIPYAFLGDVMDYLSNRPEISLAGMNREDFDKYERMSREILVNTMEKRDLALHGLRLCDITVNFPDLKISSAQKMLRYIQTVEEHQFSTKAADPQTEALLRQALDIPNDQKNVLGLIRNLGIGVYWARQTMAILQTFEGVGLETPKVALRSIVSEGYGKYSPYDERAQKREISPEQLERYENRQPRRDARPAVEPSREQDEEEVERPRREREPRPERQRSYERPPRRKEPREDSRAPTAKEIPSDLIGRRCLFHGGIAIARCSKCKAVLCKECIRGSERCPRCNNPLRSVDEAPPKKQAREQEEETADEPEETPRPRPKKKSEPSDDLSRL